MNDLEQRIAALEAVLGRGNFLTSTVQQKDATFNGRMKLVNRTALPATCAVGEMAMLNGVQYVCSAPNTWTASGGSAAGNNTDVQFNNSGSLGGDDYFRWDNGALTLGANSSDGKIIAPDGTAGHTGTTLALQSGNGGATDEDGGDLNVLAGDGSGDGTGGDLFLAGGTVFNGSSLGNGGDATLEAGSGSNQTGSIGGNVNLLAGGGDEAGFIYLSPGGGVTSQGYTQIETGERRRLILSCTGNTFLYKFMDNFITLNATPAASTIVAVPTDASIYFEVKVSATRYGGTAGSAGDSASYVRRACYKNIAGVVSIVGSIQDSFTVEDQAGWDVTFVISGTNINIQVTGAVDNDIEWVYEATYMPSFASFIN